MSLDTTIAPRRCCSSRSRATTSRRSARGCCSRLRTHSWLHRRTNTAVLPPPRRTFRGSHEPPRRPRAPPSQVVRAPPPCPSPRSSCTAPTRPSACACARFTRRVARWDQAASSRRRRCRPSSPCMPRRRASVWPSRSTTRSCLAPAGRARPVWASTRSIRSPTASSFAACRTGSRSSSRRPPSTRQATSLGGSGT